MTSSDPSRAMTFRTCFSASDQVSNEVPSGSGLFRLAPSPPPMPQIDCGLRCDRHVVQKTIATKERCVGMMAGRTRQGEGCPFPITNLLQSRERRLRSLIRRAPRARHDGCVAGEGVGPDERI